MACTYLHICPVWGQTIPGQRLWLAVIIKEYMQIQVYVLDDVVDGYTCLHCGYVHVYTFKHSCTWFPMNVPP